MSQRVCHIDRTGLLILPALFILSLTGGCAVQRTDDGLLKLALQERAAASMQLAKAITRYCSVTTETLLARDACLLEQRLAALQQEFPDGTAVRSPLRRRAPISTERHPG